MSDWSTGQNEVVEVTYREPNRGLILTERVTVKTGSSYEAKLIVEGRYGAGSVLGFAVVDRY